MYYIKIKILASAIYFNQLKYFFQNLSETHPGASNCLSVQPILDREQKYLDKRTNFDRVDSIDCIISHNKPNNHKQSAADTNMGWCQESESPGPRLDSLPGHVGGGWRLSSDTWSVRAGETVYIRIIISAANYIGTRVSLVNIALSS